MSLYSQRETKKANTKKTDYTFQPSIEKKIDIAIKEWRTILNEKHVIIDEDSCKKANNAKFHTTQKIIGIIKPASTKDVSLCIKVANKYHINIYPISKGYNWGLGSKTPVKPQSVLMDLSRMCKITNCNIEQRTITVEPGVSFLQTHQYLTENNTDMFVSVIGGPPEASVIGNAIERGDGIGPLSDRAEHICNLEVVLADGTIINTGYGRFKNSKVATLSKYGLGPSLDGLFMQSSFGIITKASIWLSPKPNSLDVFKFKTNADSTLVDIIKTFKELYQHNVLTAPIYIWNNYKHLGTIMQYPWKKTNGSVPLKKTTLDKLAKELSFAKWNGFGAIYSFDQTTRSANKKTVKSQIKKSALSIQFFNQKMYNVLRPFKAIIKRFFSNEYRDILQWENHPFCGRPMTITTNSLYWRKTGTIKKNPDTDNVGLIWQSIAIPFCGKEVIQSTNIIENHILKSNFEPNIAMMLTTGGRIIRLFFCINYDRDVPGEDKRAMDCHQKLFQELENKGYTHNRIDISTMALIPKNSDKNYSNVLKKIKSCLDPSSIISPGRYP